MTRGSYALCALYLATALWLAWCTVTTWGQVPTWVSLLNAAASIVAVIAVVRDAELGDERRWAAVLCEREGRRTAWGGPPPADGEPLDLGEQAAFAEIAAHWDDRSAA